MAEKKAQRRAQGLPSESEEESEVEGEYQEKDSQGDNESVISEDSVANSMQEADHGDYEKPALV